MYAIGHNMVYQHDTKRVVENMDPEAENSQVPMRRDVEIRRALGLIRREGTKGRTKRGTQNLLWLMLLAFSGAA